MNSGQPGCLLEAPSRALPFLDPAIAGSDDALSFFASILQSTTEYSIIGKDLDGTLVLWNEGARRLYGYEPDEVLGRANASILYSPEDIASELPDEMNRIALSEGKWEGMVTRQRRDGSRFVAHVVMTPRKDSQGVVRGFLLISTKITPELKLSEKLRSIQEHFRAISSEGDHRPAVLVVDDMPVNVRLVRAMLSGIEIDVVAATSGREALDLISHRKLALALIDVCMPDMNGYELATQLRAAGNGVPIIFLTAHDRSEEAMRLAYSVGGADILYKPLDADMLQAKVGVFLDVYRNLQAEAETVRELEALQEALIRERIEIERLAFELGVGKAEADRASHELALRNAQLESFTHVVSHDLRQPLGSILDYLEVLQASSADHLDRQDLAWIQSCRKIGRDMQELIGNVLDFSSLGARTPPMEHVAARMVLAAALANLNALINESGAVISSGDLPAVLGAQTLLISLFQNLISNAIKYRGDGPPVIHLSSEWSEQERMWMFRIADNGRGFSKSEAGLIFEMFGRSESSSSVPGTGIGLATCKRIVEAHGGRIWAKSVPGKGADFFFLLPDSGTRRLQKTQKEN